MAESTDRYVINYEHGVLRQIRDLLTFGGGGRRAQATLTFAGQPVAAETVILDDGVNTAVTLTADTDFAIGATAEATLDNLIAAINAYSSNWQGVDGNLNITATKSGTTIVLLKNDYIGTAGNTTITNNLTNVTETNFTLGEDVGHLDTEMTIDLTGTDINVGSVNILDQADNQIDPSAAYAEDVAYTAADWVTPVGLVRKDARALPGSSADGDYTTGQVTGNGDLRVRDDDLMTNMGAVGDAADVDGTVAGQLRYIGEAVDYLETRVGTNGDAADVDGTQAGQLRYIGEQLDGTGTGTLDDGTNTVIRALVSPNDAQPLADYFDATDQLPPLYVADAGLSLDNEPIADVMATLYDRFVTDWGSVGEASDVDGSAHSQLRYIGESVDDLEADLAIIAAAVYVDDADWSDGASRHILVGGLYQSAQQSVTDGDVGPFQIDDHGNQIVTILSDDAHFGTVGAAADPDGVIHGQLRSIAENTDTLEALLAKGTGAMAASHSVTLATDDTQLGAVGAAADADGNVHGQLRFIAEAVDGLETDLATVASAVHADDDIYNALDPGVFALAVRNDSLGTSYATADQSYNPIATTEKGAVHVALGNGVTNMATVDDANTARTTGTHVIVTQPVDAEGHVVDWSDLDDIRQAVQIMDDWDTTTASGLNIHGHDAVVAAAQVFGRSAAGTVGEITATGISAAADNIDGNTGLNVAAALFARIDDNTVEHVHMIDAIHSLKGDVSSVAGTATNVNGGNRDAGTQTVTLADDDPAVALLGTIDADTGTIAGDTTSIDGKITACNTGAVTISAVPDSIMGPAEPVIDSYTSVAISAAAATANQELVSAPGASKQIWVYGLVGTADTGAGSISLQDEDDAALSGVMPVAENGGFSMAPSGNFSMPWIKVATNKALEVDTLVCGFKGVLTYAVVSV